ncbi:MAG: serine protease [Clostridia bacterium]|nr:serine protease [Clostridia bacterium]
MKKKKHSGGTIALIAVLVAVAVLLSATVGCFAGVVMAMMQGTPEETDGTKAPMSGNDNVSVNQNANIVVNQTTPSADGNLSVADVVELVADSVVEITTTYRDSDGSLVSGAGSGVLVGENQNYGYLITNFHVAGSYAESIAVRLTNEEIYDADYVTGDQASDLAIVRIAKKNGESFTVATLVENCDGLRKGDDVIAIGNPLAMLPGTVTEGIISNKSVTLMVDGFVMDLYQVSAAVNPGNSGGGLFNRAGQLVGIVNAKVSAEGVEGLAFAIPGDYVNRFVMDALDDGDVTGKPTIGVSAVYSSLYGQVGMFVASTTTSAVQVNDRICSINGVTITNESDYMEAMHALENGQTITVVMERGTFYFPNRVSWSEYSITVTVGEYNTND